MSNDLNNLDQRHWELETFTQRMTAKQWKNVLLNRNEQIIFRGEMRQLVAKKLGYGVVEVSKDPKPVKLEGE